MRSKIIIVSAIAVIAGGALLSLLMRPASEEFQLEPQAPSSCSAAGTRVTGTQVGTGWSVKENPTEAVREAVNMAFGTRTHTKPDFAVIYASSGSNMERILDATRSLLGEDVKIFGGTSDSRAVMTDKGFVKVTERGYQSAETTGRRGLAIMTVSSNDIVFGVASANLSRFASPQEMSKIAALSAMQDAGRTVDEPPKIVLLSCTIGIEEEILKGIEQALGKDVPVLGGTVGGPEGAVFGQDKPYSEGISLAVIYTNLPIGWTFEGGFDVTKDSTGVVTETDGHTIVEIDGRPALDVYNEWLDGEIERLHSEVNAPDQIRDLLTLHPFYRKYESPSGQDYFLFSHPWPRDDEMKDRAICTGTEIEDGERIYLSHGTWETLLNRIGNMPRNAKVHAEIRISTRPVFAMGFVCAGVMGVIPDRERDKMPYLINYANNNAPFIANFTWGEQGYFPGIGCRHGNLLTAFLVIGPGGTQE